MEAGQERAAAALRADAIGMLLRAERLPELFGALAGAYDAVPRVAVTPERGTVLDGQVAIQQRISELVGDCREEVMAAQPGPRNPETLAVSRHQDGALLARGVRLRTIYQPVVLDSPGTVGHAALMTAAGARTRVLDEPYQRMVVIDRKVAVVPTGTGPGQAAFIAEQATVAFLVAVFERDWERASAPDWGGLGESPRSGPAARRVGRLLATGLTQKAVASRLGLSERTVAGHIARLREQYGAQTLFQLGWRMRGDRDA
ncbi:LuxR C-terminal-related transcriptional regulator [Kitasatospora sp. NPDC004289]